jgi:microcystin-dependent protein
MSEPFLGEIRMFAGNFAPRGWAFCDGQLLPISQNSALFSILGTAYGGNGISDFGLPDLRGRVPIHEGQGPGLNNRALGSKGGAENTIIGTENLPAHNHNLTLQGSSNTATDTAPAGKVPANSGDTRRKLYADATNLTSMGAAGSISNTGGGQAMSNMQPYQTVNYIIALQGLFPSRT